MTHLFINSLAASAGGGLTYARNVIPHLAAQADVRITAAVSPKVHRDLLGRCDVDFLELEIPSTRRLWYEQRLLPGVIRQTGADVLLSAGNFALRNSPVPQVLLSRNSIYTSRDFFRDLWSRGEYRMLLDTNARAVLARKSVHWADITVAPSNAFAKELERWTGRKVNVIHHGFDRVAFTRNNTPLPADVNLKLEAAEGSLKILFVSHYNYYRNFETLIRSLPLLRSRFSGKSIRLLLTCQLASGKNPGAYNPDSAAQLIRAIGVSDMVAELGSIPYAQLHQLYARADLYVTPAYTETFAHPLVEAMSSGVPIVASDIAVHREICDNAALYFGRFSPNELVERVAQVIEQSDTARGMAVRGISRAAEFSWSSHAQQILELSRKLVRGWQPTGPKTPR